jgi:hypothetical protein
MKLKKLLLLGTVILSCSLSAQEGEAPTTIIQGTFIGKTIFQRFLKIPGQK